MYLMHSYLHCTLADSEYCAQNPLLSSSNRSINGKENITMPLIIEMITTLTNRLPELEYRLDEIGKIWCSELPKGLFRSSQYVEWITSGPCIAEIRADLDYLR